MKAISHLLMLATLASISVGQSYAGPTHPASKEWVAEQLGKLVLTTTDWTNLCPNGQSIDSTTGCTPNCTQQKDACNKLLTLTDMEDEVLIQSTAPTGFTVFRLTISPTLTQASPTYHNGSGTNSVRCQVYTARGHLFSNENPNKILASGATDDFFQDYTGGVALGPNSTNSATDFLNSAPDAGSQRLNQQYFVICMSYTTSSHVANNVNMDGTLNITWT